MYVMSILVPIDLCTSVVAFKVILIYCKSQSLKIDGLPAQFNIEINNIQMGCYKPVVAHQHTLPLTATNRLSIYIQVADKLTTTGIKPPFTPNFMRITPACTALFHFLGIYGACKPE